MSGVLWAVGCAVAFSLSHVSIRRAGTRLDVGTSTTIQLAISLLAIGLAAALFSGWQVLSTASLTGLLYFAAVGLVHFCGGWSLVNASTRLVGAARMSAITGISPLLAALFALFFLGESLNAYIGTGILLIVFGAYNIATS